MTVLSQFTNNLYPICDNIAFSQCTFWFIVILLKLRDADSERRRSWVSSSNLASDRDNNSVKSESNYSNPSSWTSTPDLAKLEDDTQAVTTVSIKLPKRKQKPIDTGQRTGN